MKKVYLAGFDVFRPDAVSYGQWLKALCVQHGFAGLYPLDNAAPEGLSGAALADWIYRANIALIEQADCVMANLNPFRGLEPDSGTVFEVGYAVAKGKPVWVYTEQTASLVAQAGVQTQDGRVVDAQGYTVEDFGMNLNLMIACSTNRVLGDAQICLQAMQAQQAGSD
ncbi:nucleoside 2-deoxyribosyltransferase [Advenella mimigardefordensis]|uniref:Putative nucleoside 2-deoxyribosyltransferase n=1 Tax=Advenella mimigardefordensis (strain DSM 17166 / LMG 22922 / DPN7) TaxID=1247726 RepID=W0PAF8_ADVMD|nr:nucleoside 2-deoxyribosyltransferase [Advenella mimigardefordensis]AHG62405.1 putative nucleoside 2-deoxyribosyltransferase [Advenella mimigardefordensis DPN7]